ncbi:hypothetical protein ACIQU4_39630 [Streptomyces sp. NPDC090741]|uniref:hypothetical protein n=1 Tax=Streptomyces sp. NPDC090741 TaxID=3365967 RepID=UPI003809E7B8
MNQPSAAPQSFQEKEKPGWSLLVVLFGVVTVLFRFTGVWSWWALLWAPAFVLAVGFMAYEWRLLARSRWRMSALEWVFLVGAHLGFAASLAAILSFPRRW